jgi:chemotaxis signal transduction protein
MGAVGLQNGRGAHAAHDLPFVIFGLGAQRYALAVQAVVEIVRLPALTPLHGASPAVCGLLNWHGRFLPVLDGRALVDEPPCCDLSSQVMLVGAIQDATVIGPQFGLLVDAVYGVQTVPAPSLTRLPSASVAPYQAAVFHERDGAAVILLDIAALLALAPALHPSIDQVRRNGAAPEQ